MQDLMARHGEVVDRIVATPPSLLPDEVLKREILALGVQQRRLAAAAHHIRWWRHGGSTDRHNLVLLCAFHHYLVHDRGWTVTMDPTRTVTFTSPDGMRSYTSRPRGPTQLVR